MIDRILEKLQKYGYADARLEKRVSSTIRISDKEVDATSGSISGISVRVLKNKSWGFASSNSVSMESFELLLKKAEKLAAVSSGKARLADAKIKDAKARAKSKDNIGISMEEKIGMLKDAAKHIEGRRVKNRIVSISDEFSTTTFMNSDGITVEQDQSYTYLNCTAIAKKGSLIQRGAERCARVDGYKKITFHKCAEEAGNKAERLLDSEAPPAGRMIAVLDPEMTGVFSHEALGHASEADAVAEKESILCGKLGKRIGNGLVTIFDDPTANDFGFYAYDDEGVEARKTTLVKNGMLKGYLSSRETCEETGVTANGHARAEDYSHVPIVRMGNTFFKPGKSSREDVFDVKDGIYLKGMKGGSVDIFAGGFMFKADEAYEIRDGELGKLYRDTAISGNIMETLKNVEAVGKDFGTSPGFCGKGGQQVPVSDGGPHIRIKDVKIG